MLDHWLPGDKTSAPGVLRKWLKLGHWRLKNLRNLLDLELPITLSQKQQLPQKGHQQGAFFRQEFPWMDTALEFGSAELDKMYWMLKLMKLVTVPWKIPIHCDLTVLIEINSSLADPFYPLIYRKAVLLQPSFAWCHSMHAYERRGRQLIQWPWCISSGEETRLALFSPNLNQLFSKKIRCWQTDTLHDNELSISFVIANVLWYMCRTDNLISIRISVCWHQVKCTLIVLLRDLLCWVSDVAWSFMSHWWALILQIIWHDKDFRSKEREARGFARLCPSH